MRIKTDLLLIGLALLILIVIWQESSDDTLFSRTGTGDSERKDLHQEKRNKQVTKPDHKHHERRPVFTGATMFVYWPPPLSGMKRPGKKFTVDLRLAKQIKQMSKRFFVLNEKTVDKFVFVTAASSNHFEETIDGVASVQRHFPGRKLFYYDLGLDQHQVVAIKSWKWVEYRRFDFSKYPEYFHRNLRMVGWKPIVIQEVMAEYGAVFWMDASIRLLTSDFSAVYRQLRENGGIVLFKNTKHSNYAATHGGTYAYLPTNTTRQMLTPMCIATAILAYNTKAMFYNVLWWFFICALQEDCQAPMAKTMCKFDLANKWATFADCHKWDQSTLNVLLSNYFGYDHWKYMTKEGVVAVERWPTHRYTIKLKDD